MNIEHRRLPPPMNCSRDVGRHIDSSARQVPGALEFRRETRRRLRGRSRARRSARSRTGRRPPATPRPLPPEPAQTRANWRQMRQHPILLPRGRAERRKKPPALPSISRRRRVAGPRPRLPRTIVRARSPLFVAAATVGAESPAILGGSFPGGSSLEPDPFVQPHPGGFSTHQFHRPHDLHKHQHESHADERGVDQRRPGQADTEHPHERNAAPGIDAANAIDMISAAAVDHPGPCGPGRELRSRCCRRGCAERGRASTPVSGTAKTPRSPSTTRTRYPTATRARVTSNVPVEVVPSAPRRPSWKIHTNAPNAADSDKTLRAPVLLVAVPRYR